MPLLPDEPEENGMSPLPEDNQTPFQPAAPPPYDTAGGDPLTGSPPPQQLDDTHPVTDSNMQPEEQYEQGLPGAAEATEPNAGKTVTDYNSPDEDDTQLPDDNAL